MHEGRTVLSQTLDSLPCNLFRRCVQRYVGNHGIRSFISYEQFLCKDRAYLNFYRLYQMHQDLSFIILRDKRKTRLRQLYSAAVDKACGVVCDQTVVTTNQDAAIAYPEKSRRKRYYDRDKQKRFVFLTYNIFLGASTIAAVCKCRWQVKLFLKWTKRHLRIKSFFGYSENAVKTQIWIAISIYVLVALMKKRLGPDQSLYTILQLISIALFIKVSIYQWLMNRIIDLNLPSGVSN